MAGESQPLPPPPAEMKVDMSKAYASYPSGVGEQDKDAGKLKKPVEQPKAFG